MARILIAGLAKSGTTGLWSKIVNSYSWWHHSYFENDYLGQTKKRMICKQLIGPNFDVAKFEIFEKIVWIVRDPRDRLISYCLYRAYDHRYDDESFVRELLGLLAQKENDSDSVSIERLEKLVELPTPTMQSSFFWNDASIPKDRGFVLKYEDFVDGRFDGLEEYLGRKLTGKARVPKKLSRVVRTKSHGFWRDWFTAEDVEHYRPLFQEFMELYNYPADWETHEVKTVDPNACSRYARRIVNERRAGEGLPKIPEAKQA